MYLNSGWLAYLVGDLLVLPEHQSHSLYPTNITSTHIPTAAPTIEVSTSTVFPAGGKGVSVNYVVRDVYDV